MELHAAYSLSQEQGGERDRQIVALQQELAGQELRIRNRCVCFFNVCVCYMYHAKKEH